MYNRKIPSIKSIIAIIFFIAIKVSAQSIPANYYKPKVDFTTESTPFQIATGDVDGDGKVEMVIANANSNTISVFHNTSDAGGIDASSFADKVDFPTENYPVSVVLRDVDGDGKPDLVVANRLSDNVSILRNTSTFGVINASSFAAPVYFSSGSGPLSVFLADLDGDGKPDIAVANYNSNTVSILRNTAVAGVVNASSFEPKVEFPTGPEPSILAAGDLDMDGKYDLAVSNFASASVSVLRNTSSTGTLNASSFASKVDFATGDNPYGVNVGDLDGDGKPELVVVNVSSVSVSVLHNTSTPGSINATSFDTKVDFTTGNHPVIAAVGDLNGDAKPDLVVSNQLSDNISVLRNSSVIGSVNAMSFDAKVDFATGREPVAVAISDFDADAVPELAVNNYASNSVSVFQVDSPCRNLAISCSNSNSVLYFGYTGDQTVTIAGLPTGGTAPYSISISMDRPLKCNVMNASGNEVWTSGPGVSSSSNTTCPTSNLTPISTANGVPYGEASSVTATLMADAVFTVTVTDALGCKATCTTKVHAEDVRCFSGNAAVQKITLCHRTGDDKKPCVKICVDQSAVQEHLAHGDFLGNCTLNCIPPSATSSSRGIQQQELDAAASFNVKLLSNPSSSAFKIKFESNNIKDVINLRVVDVRGEVIDLRKNILVGQTLLIGSDYAPGIYFLEANQGKNKKQMKLIKL